MRFSTLKYHIDSALESIFKNKVMSIASVITVVSCILIFILSFCVASNLDYVLKKFEGAISFRIFFSDEIPESNIFDLQKSISSIENVDDIVYINKEGAFDEGLLMFEESTSIMQGFEEDNPLPRSLDVSISSINFQDQIIAQIETFRMAAINKFTAENENFEGKDDDLIRLKFHDVQIISRMNRILRIVSTIFVLAMGTLSTIIITNTIKLTVNNRQREIGIMKYVGATNWFIRWPFLIEGIIIGIVGAAISIALGFVIYNRLLDNVDMDNFISRLMKLDGLMPLKDIFIFIIPVSLLIGALIGALGSLSSIRKYLQV